ncbi:thioesterase family protein [Caproiciproducens galactitolivorans]|uniref:Thioesterase family protein n=1 Tax=Caproiciproducens galactitolivorans TaxID=642589 RepID=A0ABT4BVL6_9FIRM|nr:thioesterase family protein [Caproiciproducens galactitolivorans]MCY1714932.1 thioesterase family protein [Caproiciproducens galactitolivorans]
MKETKLTREYTVTEDMLAVNFGSGSVRVLATPKVAAFFEGTAAELAQKSLEEPFTTVGSVITVEHLAPTALGCKVSVTAELTEIDGRTYRFKLEAYDNAGLIATGTHERVSVKKDRFEEKAEARKNTARQG